MKKYIYNFLILMCQLLCVGCSNNTKYNIISRRGSTGYDFEAAHQFLDEMNNLPVSSPIKYLLANGKKRKKKPLIISSMQRLCIYAQEVIEKV